MKDDGGNHYTKDRVEFIHMMSGMNVTNNDGPELDLLRMLAHISSIRSQFAKAGSNHARGFKFDDEQERLLSNTALVSTPLKNFVPKVVRLIGDEEIPEGHSNNTEFATSFCESFFATMKSLIEKKVDKDDIPKLISGNGNILPEYLVKALENYKQGLLESDHMLSL